MDSYKRFSDEEYKHWLRVAESLFILRSNIRQFVEKETESYHKTLREKLKDIVCGKKCTLSKWTRGPKKHTICEKCEEWKDAIFRNHNHKGLDIHWNNCQPHLWPTDKWEVAKAYMGRGIKDHKSFDEFDISAVLNFMHHCNHFKGFTDGQSLTKVINVRNKVMHSPDFRFSKKDMDESIQKVQELAKSLEKYAPGLKTISEEIQKFTSILEKFNGQVSQSTLDSKGESLKLLDREQQALKEKIEFLAHCYKEDDQVTELKDELQGMKNFLDQNKDLLENLGPHVNQLNEIQEKVNRHEQVIYDLHNRVEQLETPDPVFSGDVLKYKNHVFEEARRRNMPEPEFTEECEASGYRGIVKVNGRLFRGTQVCNSKKSAHQEVAKIALKYMKELPETSEASSSTSLTTSSLTSSSTSPSTSSSSTIYYGIVTVVLKNQEIVSDECVQPEEAIESAYRKLACQFGLTPKSNTCRSVVLEHFQKHNFLPPQEHSDHKDDKALCKLQISGPFTFYDDVGSSKKRLAEQQAAKVALQRLSGLLDCSFDDEAAGTNYKGFLKEHLEALGLEQPEYKSSTTKDGAIEELEGPRSEDSSHLSTTKEMSKNDHLQPQSNVTVVQDLPTAHTAKPEECQRTEPMDCNPPEIPNKDPKLDSADRIFYGIVTVFLKDKEVVSDLFDQEEQAIESAYRKLASRFGLTALEGKAAVREHFQRCKFPLPRELAVPNDDKFLCKLQLSGDFTFSDPVGSSKKKLAEQQAAKIALQHLSGLFNCTFEDEAGKNYKGFLKEQLDALHLKSPVYRCKVKEEVEWLGTSGDSLHSSGTTAIGGNVCPQPKDNVSQEGQVMEIQDSPLHIPNKSLRLDYTAIDTLLELFHLKPPTVTVESVNTETIFSCRVDIYLDNFTFLNNNEYTAKKDAIRKTYFLFGNALGISKLKLDEINASMLVKQDFSQKSLPLPKEVFEDKKCSLKDITYPLVYDGKGSSEAEAKQDALQKALDALNLLFGFKSLPKCRTSEETEVQVNTLLRTKSQKELIYSHKPNQYKSSIELLFKDYTMESKLGKKKKENVNNLCSRILGLLAVEPEPNTVSVRNCLDEWFKRRNLTQPVFKDTEEAHGSKVTFSVKVSCSTPNWEDSTNAAEEKLAEEFERRLKCLTD